VLIIPLPLNLNLNKTQTTGIIAHRIGKAVVPTIKRKTTVARITIHSRKTTLNF
jgi:hypothetical protein